MQTQRGKRRERIGVVFSDKMDKTVVVRVERYAQHKKYGKILKLRKKFKAHDEKNEARIGDRVVIRETRPLSKQKRWMVTKILKG